MQCDIDEHKFQIISYGPDNVYFVAAECVTVDTTNCAVHIQDCKSCWWLWLSGSYRQLMPGTQLPSTSIDIAS